MVQIGTKYYGEINENKKFIKFENDGVRET